MQREGLFPTLHRKVLHTHRDAGTVQMAGRCFLLNKTGLLEFGGDGHDQVHTMESVETELETE